MRFRACWKPDVRHHFNIELACPPQADGCATLQQLQGTNYITANLTWISASRLLTTPIAWPFGAAKALVMVKLDSQGPFCDHGGGAFVFSFEEGVTATEVSERRVFAMEDVNVAFRGEGFGLLSTYSCILVSADTNLSSHGNASMSDFAWERNISATTTAANTSRIVCPALKWPFAAQQVVPLLLRNGSVVSGSLRRPLQIIEIMQHWTHVTPRQVSAQGQVITVRK